MKSDDIWDFLMCVSVATALWLLYATNYNTIMGIEPKKTTIAAKCTCGKYHLLVSKSRMGEDGKKEIEEFRELGYQIEEVTTQEARNGFDVMHEGCLGYVKEAEQLEMF